MSQSNYITLALFAVIGLVFLVDYLNRKKEDSFDKSVEKFVQKKGRPSKVKIFTIIVSLILLVCSIVFNGSIDNYFQDNNVVTQLPPRIETKLKERFHADGESYYNKLIVNTISRIQNDSAFDQNNNYMGILKNGHREGEWRDYNENNFLIIHGSYKNGLMNGFFKHYDKYGVLHHEGSYINGSGEKNQNSGIPVSGRRGLHLFYYPNGQKSGELNHNSYGYHGVQKKFWNNGVVKTQYEYNNNYELESTFIDWDRNGKIIE